MQRPQILWHDMERLGAQATLACMASSPRPLCPCGASEVSRVFGPCVSAHHQHEDEWKQKHTRSSAASASGCEERQWMQNDMAAAVDSGVPTRKLMACMTRFRICGVQV